MKRYGISPVSLASIKQKFLSTTHTSNHILDNYKICHIAVQLNYNRGSASDCHFEVLHFLSRIMILPHIETLLTKLQFFDL